MSEQNQSQQLLHNQQILHNHSRRLFLRGMALAGAGLVAAPLLTPQAALAGGLFAVASPQDQKKVGD